MSMVFGLIPITVSAENDGIAPQSSSEQTEMSVMKMTAGGTQTYYDDIGEAFGAAANAGTSAELVMLNDITTSEIIGIPGGQYTS